MTKSMKPRLKGVELLEAFRTYASQVAAGADPIEALSGHLCGPRCWHWEELSPARQAELLQAPWNQPGSAAKPRQ